MLKRVCKCIPASKLVWVLGRHFAHKIHSVILPFSYTFVLATKQTLLSVLLANHALFETYFQDEGSQMNTQSKLEDLWQIHDLKSEEWRLFANLKNCLLLSYVIMSLCYA